MAFTPILGTLGYVTSEDEAQVLMLHRNRKEGDYHQGIYNGVGGKVESGEDVNTGMRRELKEETGLTAEKMSLRGMINFTGFGPYSEDWIVFIYLIQKVSGDLIEQSPEGDLHWINRNKIETLPMWEGDKYFLPLVFDEDPRIFSGFMPYENSKPLKWSFDRS